MGQAPHALAVRRPNVPFARDSLPSLAHNLDGALKLCVQEGPDRQESITVAQPTAQRWLLQLPSTSSVKGFACSSKARNLCAGFAAQGTWPVAGAKEEAKVWLVLTSCSKEKREIASPSAVLQCPPTAQHNKQRKGRKYPKKPPCEIEEVTVPNSSHRALHCPRRCRARQYPSRRVEETPSIRLRKE